MRVRGGFEALVSRGRAGCCRLLGTVTEKRCHLTSETSEASEESALRLVGALVSAVVFAQQLHAQKLEALWYSTSREESTQSFLAHADHISIVLAAGVRVGRDRRNSRSCRPARDRGGFTRNTSSSSRS